jgi:multiple sugar transport system permease protein
MSVSKRGTRKDILLEITLFIFIAFLMLPVFWLVLTSLKTEVDSLVIPPKIFILPTLENYINVFNTEGQILSLWNSLLIGLSSTFFCLLVGVPAAYSLARFSFRFKNSLGIWILITRMAPPVGMLIPFYIMFRYIGAIDTYSAMIIAHMAMNLPIVTWLLIGFFQNTPKELEEAAYIDGCTSFGAFFRITLPLVANGVIAVGIIGFIFSWNELMIASIITGAETRTAPSDITDFLLYHEIQYGNITAAAVALSIPALALIGFAQKKLVVGLGFGSEK